MRDATGTLVAAGTLKPTLTCQGETNMAPTIDRGTLRVTARPGRRREGRAGERGQALIEAAFTIPLLLFVSVLIFEFGRAYQVAQVLTNAAREGARVAILQNATQADVQARGMTYLQNGGGPPHPRPASALNTAAPPLGRGTGCPPPRASARPFSLL